MSETNSTEQLTTTPASTEASATTLPGESQPQRDSTGTLIDQSTTPSTPSAEGEKTGGEEPPKPAEGAPETYADFKAPEGYTIDPKVIGEAAPIFKELGLSQDQAQKLVDFHSKAMIDAAKAPQAAYEALRTDWKSKVSADAEMGSKLDTVKADIGRMFALLPTDLVGEVKQAFDLTGAGDHPAVIKSLWKLSQLVTEGKHVAGKGPSELGQKAPDVKAAVGAKALYPNLP